MVFLLLILVLLLSWSENKEMDMIVDEEPILLKDEAGLLLEGRVIVEDGAMIGDRASQLQTAWCITDRSAASSSPECAWGPRRRLPSTLGSLTALTQ